MGTLAAIGPESGGGHRHLPSLPSPRAVLLFNGNTFVAIARGIIRPVLEQLTARDAMGAAAFRSVVGHFVAGTEGLEELRAALRDALD